MKDTIVKKEEKKLYDMRSHYKDKIEKKGKLR